MSEQTSSAVPIDAPKTMGQFFSGFFFATVVIVAFGFLQCRTYGNNHSAQAGRQLSAIAKLVSFDVAPWRKERLTDASSHLGNDELYSRAILASRENGEVGEVPRRLLGDQRTRFLPVVILTSGEEYDVACGQAPGAGSFVRKLMDCNWLIDLIRQLPLCWLPPNLPRPAEAGTP